MFSLIRKECILDKKSSWVCLVHFNTSVLFATEVYNVNYYFIPL